MAATDRYSTATLSFKFRSETDSYTSKLVPSLRSGFTSSKEVVTPTQFSENKCLTLFHSYGESPSEVFHTGHGSLSYMSSGSETFEEFVNVSGSNTVTLTGTPKGGVSFSDINLTVIKEVEIDGKKVLQGSSTTPSMTYNALTGTVTLSSNNTDKFYGSFVASYSATKTLYIVDLSSVICPETAEGAKDLVNPSFTVTALFSKGASSSNGTRDSQCCSDKQKQADSKKDAKSGGIASKNTTGRSSGCLKLLHFYGQDASSIQVIKGPIISVTPDGGYSEQFEETLVFNGSTSVGLSNPAQGSVLILDKTPFKGTGYYAVYAPDDTTFSNPKKGEFSKNIPEPNIVFNPETNSLEASKSLYILDPKYYGAVVVSYTSKRFDYAVEFSTEYCPEDDDSPEEQKYKDEKAKGLLYAQFSEGGVGTISIDRDSSCCPKREKDGYTIEEYSVRCEPISVKERFFSHFNVEHGNPSVGVLEYLLINGYGQYEFEIKAYSIKSGVFGPSSGGDIATIPLKFAKVYTSTNPYAQTITIKSSASGSLMLIPIDPSYTIIEDLIPDHPVSGALKVIFGVKTSYVYSGEYDAYKRSYRITGTKYIKPDEYAVVDANGVLVSCSGIIKISYTIRYSVYQLDYNVTKESFTDPTHNVKYSVSYHSKSFNITGEASSEVSIENNVSKKEVKTLTELFGQKK